MARRFREYDGEEEFNEPVEGDLATSDHSKFYEVGSARLAIDVSLEASREEMWAKIDAWMKKHNFYPNVWFISDHGNAHLMERPQRKKARRR